MASFNFNCKILEIRSKKKWVKIEKRKKKTGNMASARKDHMSPLAWIPRWPVLIEEICKAEMAGFNRGRFN